MLTLLILITFSSYAVEGYQIEKIVEVRYAGGKHITGKFGACLPDAGSQLKDVKDLIPYRHSVNQLILEEEFLSLPVLCNYEKGCSLNKSFYKFTGDAFQELQGFIKEHGAPVQTLKVDTQSYRFVKETIKKVKRVDIPESMFKPPKDYEEIKLPI